MTASLLRVPSKELAALLDQLERDCERVARYESAVAARRATIEAIDAQCAAEGRRAPISKLVEITGLSEARVQQLRKGR